jgi:hypothetical protein
LTVVVSRLITNAASSNETRIRGFRDIGISFVRRLGATAGTTKF